MKVLWSVARPILEGQVDEIKQLPKVSLESHRKEYSTRFGRGSGTINRDCIINKIQGAYTSPFDDILRRMAKLKEDV